VQAWIVLMFSELLTFHDDVPNRSPLSDSDLPSPPNSTPNDAQTHLRSRDNHYPYQLQNPYTFDRSNTQYQHVLAYNTRFRSPPTRLPHRQPQSLQQRDFHRYSAIHMSAVVSRHPLQEIGMSASQRPKRKSTRYPFDDDDVQLPQAKKNKVEAVGKQANGTTNGASRERRKKRTYCMSWQNHCWRYRYALVMNKF
jgi:hypothetical protein